MSSWALISTGPHTLRNNFLFFYLRHFWKVRQLFDHFLPNNSYRPIFIQFSSHHHHQPLIYRQLTSVNANLGIWVPVFEPSCPQENSLSVPAFEEDLSIASLGRFDQGRFVHQGIKINGISFRCGTFTFHYWCCCR